MAVLGYPTCRPAGRLGHGVPRLQPYRLTANHGFPLRTAMPPPTEAPDGPVRAGPQPGMSDMAQAAESPSRTRNIRTARMVKAASGDDGVGVGLVVGCVMSDMSPCGAMRTGPSGPSVSGAGPSGAQQGCAGVPAGAALAPQPSERAGASAGAGAFGFSCCRGV